MDHLNNKLNEISSRIDHLERLTLQIQRDNHLKHEELKQYISATFNLIHSSISTSTATANADKIAVVVPSGVYAHDSQQQSRQNGSTSNYDLLVPPNANSYLNGNTTDLHSNGTHLPHTQDSHAQFNNQQQDILRNPIFQRSQLQQNNTVPDQHDNLERQDSQQGQQQGQSQQQSKQGQNSQQVQHKDPKPLSDSTNTQSHDDVPLITIKRSLATVEDIWREYFYGLEGNPSIRSLDAQYGRLWRDKQKERTYFRRKKIFGFIERYMQFYNCNENQAIEYLENYRIDENTGKKRTLMWLYTHMPNLPGEN